MQRLMKKTTLKFADEFTIDLSNEMLYDFLYYAWKISKDEHNKPEDIDILENEKKTHLRWIFNSKIGIHQTDVYFKKLNKNKTKITIKEKIPDIQSIFTVSTQKYEGEAFIVGCKINFNALAHIYYNEFNHSEIQSNIKSQKKPFYLKKYSTTLELNTELEILYNFILKRYQLFNEYNNEYETLRNHNKRIIRKVNDHLLETRSEGVYGKLKTNYYFKKYQNSTNIEIKLWVPYWYLFSPLKRAEFPSVIRSLNINLRALDKVIEKYF